MLTWRQILRQRQPVGTVFQRLRFASVEWPLVWDDQLAEKVQFGGATEFFYNQRAADMESTWIALHALSECAAAGRLPKESLRPEIPPSYSSQVKFGEAPKPQAAVKSQLNATTVPPEKAFVATALMFGLALRVRS